MNANLAISLGDIESIQIRKERIRSLPGIYANNAVSQLESLIQEFFPSISELYSSEYRITNEQDAASMSNEMVFVLLQYYGHVLTNTLLTNMRVYRTGSAGRILEASGGFIPGILETLRIDGDACHGNYYEQLENDDTKYRVEFIQGVQDLPYVVLQRLYPDTNYLIDVTLAYETNQTGEDIIISSVEYTSSFLTFLSNSQLDDEHRNILDAYRQSI